jgi:hypothetical protein
MHWYRISGVRCYAECVVDVWGMGMGVGLEERWLGDGRVGGRGTLEEGGRPATRAAAAA